MEQNNRIRYMDILKGLAIIMVVMGHCDAKGGKLIYLFHMPLFFFISGYFYNKNYSFKVILKKRIKSLYLPFLKYEILFLILHNIFYKLDIYSLNSNSPIGKYSFQAALNRLFHILLFDGSEMLLSPFWFLTCLFVTTLIFTIIVKTTDKIKPKCYIRTIFILALSVLGYYLTKYNINIGFSYFCKEILNVSLVSLLFFYIGFIYKKYENKVAISKILVAIAFLLLCVGAKFNFKVDMRVNLYSNFLIFIFEAILGIYFMVALTKMLDNTKFKFTFLNYAGKNTITIMALQLISFKIISLIQVKLYNLPLSRIGGFGNIYNKKLWWIAYTVIGVVLPCIIKYIYYIFKGTYVVKTNGMKNM